MKSWLGRLGAAFERLSGREQILAVLMSFLLGGMILGFGGWLVNRDLTARDKRINSKVTRLKEIGELRGDYQRRLDEQARIAQEVRSNNGTRLLSYLDGLAQAAGVQLGNAAERPGEPTGSEQVKEEMAEVNIKNVSLDRLHKFLADIEEGNRLVKVRRLRIKTRFDNKQMLDATVTVGTFKSAE